MASRPKPKTTASAEQGRHQAQPAQPGQAISNAAGMPDPARMRAAAGTAVSMLKVMANEDRLLLLCQLLQGEMCVSELEQALDIRQPTLSQQLGVLRNEGLVATRREGKRIYYSTCDAASRQMLELLYRLYCPRD